MSKNVYFSLLLHAKQLRLVTFCDTTAGIGSGTPTGCEAYGRTDMNSYVGKK